MKKPDTSMSASPASEESPNISALVEQVRALVRSARHAVVASVNSLQVRTNYEIGHLIVEHEQQGQARADYGQAVLKGLAKNLSREFGRGYSRSNLEYMRRFYLSRPDWNGQISQTLSGKSESVSQMSMLSWSHYVLLLSIRDENERRFYEIESAQNGWSLRELQRQVNSALYERLALSRDKLRIQQLADEGQVVTTPADVIKDPYILEFLGLDVSPSYSESDLESAIISKLEHFLLELGKGFLFEARQKRFTFDEDHFYVDLVFYNRLLRCYVLIDLKLDRLTHQDLGQMQMYVNYFDRFVTAPGENPTIGIVLCKSKKDALVELTLPKDANIFAAAYELYLPSREDLRQRLIEWSQSFDDKQ